MFFTPVIRRAAYNPALRPVDRNFERFFQDAVSGAAPQAGVKGYAFDQDDTSFTLSVDVPGLAKEHLNVGIEGTVVRLESLADAPRSVKAAYEFPQEIDVAGSSAKLENGVLTLKLLKKVPVNNVASLTIN